MQRKWLAFGYFCLGAFCGFASLIASKDRYTSDFAAGFSFATGIGILIGLVYSWPSILEFIGWTAPSKNDSDSRKSF